jgi:hypothetical protein
MKPIYIIFLSVFLASCGAKNAEFNPFDDEFRLHRNYNPINYDTVYTGCGFWNLTSRNSRLQHYYEFFDDESHILGKGFNIYIDTLNIERKIMIDETVNMCKNYPFDTAALRADLRTINIIDFEILSDSTWYSVVNLTRRSGRVEQVRMEMEYVDGRFIRLISYGRRNPNRPKKHFLFQ